MRPAINSIDVISEREDLFVVTVVVLHRYLDRKIVRDKLEIEGVIMQRTLVFVQMLDEFCDPSLIVKLMRLFAFVPLVLDKNADAFV